MERERERERDVWRWIMTYRPTNLVRELRSQCIVRDCVQAAQKVILENVNWSQSIVMCLECRKLIEQRLSQLLAVLVALVADLDQCQVLEVHGCVCVCVCVCVCRCQ